MSSLEVYHYKCKKSSFKCIIYIKNVHTGPEFWFKALDMAIFLRFIRPLKTICYDINPLFKLRWSQLNDGSALETRIWNKDLLFLNEYGLNMLLVMANSREAKSFYQWMFGNILPALREHYRRPKSHIFLATTPIYRDANAYKLGSTYIDLDLKLLNMNKHRLPGDKYEFVKTWAEENAHLVTRQIARQLKKTPRSIENNFFEFNNDSEAVRIVEKILF